MKMRRSKQTKHYRKTLVFFHNWLPRFTFVGTHQFSGLMFFFCWGSFVLISLHFGGWTILVWNVSLCGKLDFIFTSNIFLFFVKFSLSKNRLKPLERTFKWSKAIWSVLKHFSDMLDFTFPFLTITSLLFEFHLLFDSINFFGEILYVTKPPQTAWDRLKELSIGQKRIEEVECDLKCFKALLWYAWFYIPFFNHHFTPVRISPVFHQHIFFGGEILYVEKPLESALDWFKALYTNRLKVTESGLDCFKAL